MPLDAGRAARMMAGFRVVGQWFGVESARTRGFSHVVWYGPRSALAAPRWSLASPRTVTARRVGP